MSVSSLHYSLSSLPARPGRGELCPGKLKIFANSPHIVDFTDAESIRPQLDIRLRQGETTVVEYPLRSAAFANIHSLSLHFVSQILPRLPRSAAETTSSGRSRRRRNHSNLLHWFQRNYPRYTERSDAKAGDSRCKRGRCAAFAKNVGKGFKPAGYRALKSFEERCTVIRHGAGEFEGRCFRHLLAMST